MQDVLARVPAQRAASRVLALLNEVETRLNQPHSAGAPSAEITHKLAKLEEQVAQQLAHIASLQAENARLRARQQAARAALGSLLEKIEAAQAQPSTTTEEAPSHAEPHAEPRAA